MRQKAVAPASLRKEPETFCWTRDHPHIALRLILVKRHDKPVQEGQHSLLVVDQAVKQVARRTLFDASFFSGWSLSGGGRRISLCQQSQELSLPILHLQQM